MSFRCVLVILTAALSLAAAQSIAAEPPRGNLSATIVPKCEIKFENSQEPVNVEANPGRLPLIERRYVTVFTLVIPKNVFEGVGGVPGIENAKRQSEVLLGGFMSTGMEYIIGKYIPMLPPGIGPSKEAAKGLADELSSPACYIARCVPAERARADYGGGFGSSPTKYYSTFHLITGTPERATPLVKAILDVYGHGLSMPEQTECLREKDSYSAEAARHARESAKVQAELTSDKKQLDALREFDDITRSSLETFKSQRRMLDVDRAGLKARIAACDKILVPTAQNKPINVEQVEGVKITAEIELAGLEAKRVEIDRIIQNGQTRLAASGRVGTEKQLAESERGRADQLSQLAKTAAEDGWAWASCPIQGSVVTHPIKWTVPEKR